MTEKNNKVDVHHHITPKEYVDQLASIDIVESYGQAFPKWTPETSLKFMDKFGIATAIASISTPGVSLKDAQFSKDLARMCNEYMADIKRNYPGRFGGFAAVPMFSVEDAVDEVTYALDTLALDGVGLFTHYDGKYLGDKTFAPLFQELNNRKAVVFIHPTDPIGKYDPNLEIANSLIEAKFETTRAVTNMITTGTIDENSEIKFILSHGGGTIPYLAWSIALGKYATKEAKPNLFKMISDIMIKGAPESGLNILRNMYYDTALSTSEWMLNTMKDFAGASHILFGTDLPFSEKVVHMTNKDFVAYSGFSDQERSTIERGNSLTLFPQFS